MTDAATFTMRVLTASGTEYLLKIDDITKFAAFASSITAEDGLKGYTIGFALFNMNP